MQFTLTAPLLCALFLGQGFGALHPTTCFDKCKDDLSMIRNLYECTKSTAHCECNPLGFSRFVPECLIASCHDYEIAEDAYMMFLRQCPFEKFWQERPIVRADGRESFPEDAVLQNQVVRLRAVAGHRVPRKHITQARELRRRNIDEVQQWTSASTTTLDPIISASTWTSLHTVTLTPPVNPILSTVTDISAATQTHTPTRSLIISGANTINSNAASAADTVLNFTGPVPPATSPAPLPGPAVLSVPAATLSASAVLSAPAALSASAALSVPAALSAPAATPPAPAATVPSPITVSAQPSVSYITTTVAGNWTTTITITLYTTLSRTSAAPLSVFETTILQSASPVVITTSESGDWNTYMTGTEVIPSTAVVSAQEISSTLTTSTACSNCALTTTTVTPPPTSTTCTSTITFTADTSTTAAVQASAAVGGAIFESAASTRSILQLGFAEAALLICLILTGGFAVYAGLDQ